MVMEEGLGEGGIITRRRRRGVVDQPVTEIFLGGTGKVLEPKTRVKELDGMSHTE